MSSAPTRVSCLHYLLHVQATINKMRCANIQAFNVDFLSLDPLQSPWNSCDAVTFVSLHSPSACQNNVMTLVPQVLVDPSCSGSGMRHEHSSVIEESNVVQLVQLQTSVLQHALSFPKAIRVVYRFAVCFFSLTSLGVTQCCSTCSHYEAENEGVVNAVRFLSLKP